MTSTQLQSEQQKIESKIISFAKKKGFTTSSIEPILDGIGDANTYLSANKKTLWVLKEPYDDVGSDGQPEGGGWSINQNFIDCPDKCAKNKTDQVITYASYGILNNINSYQEMDYIEDKPEMIKVLKQIAYINISKMPNLTNSKDSEIAKFYEIWKEILFTQIKTYSPDIIIFGNTFKTMPF